MDTLPTIPTPPAQRWREFRIQVLPLVVFLITLLAIVLMWRNYVQPTGVVGEVEAVKANLLSTADGVITELQIERFQTVAKDQQLAVVQISDPEYQRASLDAIATELAVTKAQMDLDRTRNFDAYAQRQIDLLTERLNLSLAKTRLIQAESELKRMAKLAEERLVPQGVGLERNDFGYDVALRDRDALKDEIIGREKLISHIESDIKQIESKGVIAMDPKDKLIDDAIKAQQDQLRAELQPLILKAPIDGVVSFLFKRPGERVVRGEPILTISSPTAQHIIGYVRQPVITMPTTNDTVVVRTRSQRRMMGESPILKVGVQFEMINPALIFMDSNRIEMGLPIVVGVPKDMAVTPGEFVDLSIRYARK